MNTTQETAAALPEIRAAITEIREYIKRYDEAQREMKAAERSKSPSRLEDAWGDLEMAQESMYKAIARNAPSLVHVIRNFL